MFTMISEDEYNRIYQKAYSNGMKANKQDALFKKLIRDASLKVREKNCKGRFRRISVG